MIIKERIKSLVGDHTSPYLYNSALFKAGETPIFYSGAYWDGRETEAAIHAFLNGKWITSGEYVNSFEE
jgi:CDP-6-deoxy-D-xylo-4-hexulose-3-dehydrase